MIVCAMAALAIACAPRFPHRPGHPRRSIKVGSPRHSVPRAPKLKREVIPKPPHTGAIWMPGVWTWNGQRHTWRGGYYKASPGRGKKIGHSKGKKNVKKAQKRVKW